MNRRFWRGKKVMVTGHTGFKGSWLSLWLQSMGAEVVGYALPPPTDPNLFGIAGVSRGMISVEGDIRDGARLNETLLAHRPEILIHLAAQALVHASYADPLETFSTNVMGTANLLEAVRRSRSVKAAVIITSDKCYENREWVWGYRESDPMGGHDPYSSSKGCAELVSAAYVRSFFSGPGEDGGRAAVATARAGNVIGGGDWSANRLVPDIMTALMNGHPVVIRSPGAIRPWQHVLEPLRGYLVLAETLWHHGAPFAGAWNFGPDDQDARPVSWLADFLTNAWGNGATWERDTHPYPHEATYLKLDCSKSKRLLGWWPVLGLAAALEATARWYAALQDGKEMRARTLEEIRRYEDLLLENPH